MPDMGGIPAYIGQQALAATGMDQLSLGGSHVSEEGFSFSRALRHGVSGLTDMVKGLFSVQGIAMAVGSMALVGVLGPAVIPYMLAVGVGLSGWQLGGGLMKMAGGFLSGNSREAEHAFKDIFAGGLGMGLSVWGIRGHYQGLGAQGIAVEATASETSAVSTSSRGGGLFSWFRGKGAAPNPTSATSATQALEQGWGSSLKFFVKDFMGKTRYRATGSYAGPAFESGTGMHGWASSSLRHNWNQATVNGWSSFLDKLKSSFVADKKNVVNNRELTNQVKQDRALSVLRRQHQAELARNSAAEADFLKWAQRNNYITTAETEVSAAAAAQGAKPQVRFDAMTEQGWRHVAHNMADDEAAAMISELWANQRHLQELKLTGTTFTDEAAFARSFGVRFENGRLVGTVNRAKIAAAMNQIEHDVQLMQAIHQIRAGNPDLAVLRNFTYDVRTNQALMDALALRLGNGNQAAGMELLTNMMQRGEGSLGAHALTIA
ncbi:MAG: hypothetical protein KC476_07340, partial [Cyanobacteria bacterium HKST-UBA06]|nr:hypothetical protein [Cyanobacteria bacterium HKST-UBA06]